MTADKNTEIPYGPFSITEAEHISLLFVRYWSESVREQVATVRDLQLELAQINDEISGVYRDEERNIGEPYNYTGLISGLSETLDRLLSKRIVHEHLLASSAWQMEEWKSSFERARRRKQYNSKKIDRDPEFDSQYGPWYYASSEWKNGKPAYIQHLKALRDAMEHLSEAENLAEFHVSTDPDKTDRKRRSLRMFPGSQFEVGRSLFEIFPDLDVDKLEKRAEVVASWMSEINSEVEEALAAGYRDDEDIHDEELSAYCYSAIRARRQPTWIMTFR